MQFSDFTTIVIIADNVLINKQEITLYSRDVDRAYSTNVNYLVEGFKTFFETVIVYDNPQTFVENVKLHKKDVIFPYWHGQASRNKHALVAAVCELENLFYIGADTYTNIVCADKILSKDICRLARVKYPKFITVTDFNSEITWPYRFPVVVKPVYEGSSLGMTQENLIYNLDGIAPMAHKLLKAFQQPVLVEEFIGGDEVNLAFVGWRNKIKAWSAAVRVHEKDPDFFNSNLFAFEEKNLQNDIVLRDGRHLISDELLDRLTTLFAWLDKIEYIRIDGKILDGEFYCIELTQDADLHPEGSFFTQLKYVGLDFVHSLRLLIENSLERHNNLYPS